LQQRFGNKVSVKYVDTTDGGVSEYPQVQRLLADGVKQFPIVAIDGRVRYVGTFSPTFIIRDVEKNLQSKTDR